MSLRKKIILGPFWQEVIGIIKQLTIVDLKAPLLVCCISRTVRSRGIRVPIRSSYWIGLKHASPYVGDSKARPQNPYGFPRLMNSGTWRISLLPTLHNREETYWATWRPWQHFSSTDVYLQGAPLSGWTPGVGHVPWARGPFPPLSLHQSFFSRTWDTPWSFSPLSLYATFSLPPPVITQFWVHSFSGYPTDYSIMH